MRPLIDFLLLPVLLWLAAWRLLGDRNGWLALANAWAWWLLTVALPAGMAALWRRSRAASMAWGIAGAALWLWEYGWMWQPPNDEYRLARMGGVDTDLSAAEGSSRPRSGQSDARSLALITFNLLNQERELTPLIGWMARKRPDLLLFQECIDSHATQLERGLAQRYPHRLWLPANAHSMGFGLASRLPFALTGLWQSPSFEPFAARVTFAFSHPFLPASLLDVYCVQFVSPTNEVRRMGPSALLRLREGQIDWVLGEISHRKCAALVAGDWNTTEGADAYRRATEQLVDGWREAGCGPGWSWPRRLNPYMDWSAPPVLRLDYVMHTGRRFGPGLAVAEMRVIRDDLGSDHCPLLARLVLDENSPSSQSHADGYSNGGRSAGMAAVLQ